MREDWLLAAQILHRHMVFASVPEDELLQWLKNEGEWRKFRRGEALEYAAGYSCALGLLFAGSACVRKGAAVISQLQTGELFGAVTLFLQEDAYATDITAEKACIVLFLRKDAVCKAMQRYPQLAQGYIAYLSQRVRFLTQRIAAFTFGSAEQKLLHYLKSQAQKDTHQRKMIPIQNYSVLANKLDIGRASLYRALGELEKRAVIRREEGHILLLAHETETQESIL